MLVPSYRGMILELSLETTNSHVTTVIIYIQVNIKYRLVAGTFVSRIINVYIFQNMLFLDYHFSLLYAHKTLLLSRVISVKGSS